MSLKYGPLVQWKPNQSSEKIVVIMGATGTGKSKLSIDLATYFSPSEIINSDKIQFYRSLDILTNKMPMKERRGIPHHLIDENDSINGELTAVYFRSLAGTKVSEIWSRNSLPILVGGSNSFIHAFLAKNFSADPTYSLDVGTEVSAELGYDCCFLWVDVALPVLKEYLSFRVDQMICSGMLEELKIFYESDTPSVGIAKSIGVPEFAEFFKVFPSGNHDMDTKGNSLGTNGHVPAHGDCLKHHGNCPESDAASCKKMLFQESLQAMKDNTYALAKKQIKKIELLKSSGWNIQRLDATNAIRAILETESDSVGKSSKIWEKEILEPIIKMVNQFLNKAQVRSSK
ncbi:hypothetical protein MKW92_005116 [Papaver armeniacum]|nr:hypothetical protein MKW92_005116 [Papaver armeniacum]